MDKKKKIGGKITRGKCKTLKQSITLGVEEETYFRKFSLYSWGNKKVAKVWIKEISHN